MSAGPLFASGVSTFGIELHGTEVDVLVQLEAKAEEDPSLQYPGLHVRMTNCAKVDRVKSAQRADGVIRKGHTRFQVPLPAPVELSEREGKGERLGGLGDYLDSFPDDLGTGPVAGNDCDLAHVRTVLAPPASVNGGGRGATIEAGQDALSARYIAGRGDRVSAGEQGVDGKTGKDDDSADDFARVERSLRNGVDDDPGHGLSREHQESCGERRYSRENEVDGGYHSNAGDSSSEGNERAGSPAARTA